MDQLVEEMPAVERSSSTQRSLHSKTDHAPPLTSKVRSSLSIPKWRQLRGYPTEMDAIDFRAASYL